MDGSGYVFNVLDTVFCYICLAKVAVSLRLKLRKHLEEVLFFRRVLV